MLFGLFAIRLNEKNWHLLFMISAIFIDVSLVLALEIQRGAIETATSLTLSPLQMGHVVASTVATVLYLPTFMLGYIRWKQPKPGTNYVKWHRRFGVAAFLFRTLGFILMFTLLNHIKNG